MSTVLTVNAPALKYAGSPPRAGGRKVTEYWENTNCSYVPTCLLKRAVSYLKERQGKMVRVFPVSKISCIDKNGNKVVRKSFTYFRELTDNLIKQLPSQLDETLKKQLKPAYKNHFETRLQLMWRQFLLVFGTGFQFSGMKHPPIAEGVVGKGKRGIKGSQGYEAAHSSTLPRLPYKVGKQELIFAGNTTVGDGDSTVLLPKEANEVDSAIDWRQSKEKVPNLRSRALRWLGRVSKVSQSTTPAEAFQKFLKGAAFVLKGYCKQVGEGSLQKTVVLQYQAVVRSYRKQSKDPSFFNRLCMVKGNLDAKGYIVLRDRMHGLISIEASAFQAPTPLKHSGRWVVAGKEYKIEILPTKEVKKHALTCLASVKVKEAVQAYVKKAKTVQKDLNALEAGGGHKKMCKAVSSEMCVVMDACVAEIKKIRVSRLNLIVQWVLMSS